MVSPDSFRGIGPDVGFNGEPFKEGTSRWNLRGKELAKGFKNLWLNTSKHQHFLVWQPSNTILEVIPSIDSVFFETAKAMFLLFQSGPESPETNAFLWAVLPVQLAPRLLVCSHVLFHEGMKTHQLFSIQIIQGLWQLSRFCDRCMALQGSNCPEHLDYRNIRPTAAWPLTEIDDATYRALDHGSLSPWMQMEGFNVGCVSYDWMHNVFLGTARDLVSSGTLFSIVARFTVC